MRRHCGSGGGGEFVAPNTVTGTRARLGAPADDSLRRLDCLSVANHRSSKQTLERPDLERRFEMSGSTPCRNTELIYGTGLACLLVAAPGMGEVVVDNSFGPRAGLPGPNFEIPAALGHTVGSNLFHSFESFNLTSSESATFTAPATSSYDNVVSRVTGDSASSIDGLLRSTIPGTDFYFMNPHGVVFGSSAQIDVPGAFHVTTADYVRLGNNGLFYADLGQDSILTTAPPVAFGFLAANPGALVVAGQLEVDSGRTLSLAGGDLRISAAQVLAPGGRINAVSVTGVGEIELPETPDGPVQLSGFAAGGDMRLEQGALLSTSGNGGGDIQIRAGQLELVGSKLDADNEGDTAATGGIDIAVEGAVLVDSASQVEADVNGDGAGASITIRADALEVANFSQVRTLAFEGSTGAGGDIKIDTSDRVLVGNGSNVLAATLSSGDGGNIVLSSTRLEARDGGYIATNTQLGTGNGGDITVATSDATLSAANTPGFLTGMVAQTASAGAGGDIHFSSTGALRIEDGALLSAAVYGTGAGGDLVVDAGSIEIRGIDDPNIFTGIFANVFSAGTGGDLSIQTDTLTLDNRGSISASAFSTGNSGRLRIDTGNLVVRDASVIAAGNLFGAGGSSSGMSIDADSIFIQGRAGSAEPFSTDFTGLTTTAGYQGGDAGILELTAQEMTLTSRASITASSYGSGRGGQVALMVDDLVVEDGSVVLASAFGSGDAGGVQIEADTLRVEGVNPELFVDLTGETTMAVSGIAAQSGLQGGGSGSVSVHANGVLLLDGGVIATNTFGAGDAGDITITAQRVTVSGINADLAQFLEAKGISADEARSAVKSGTASAFLLESTTGKGGDIIIVADDLQLGDGGMISANTTGPGRGGSVHVTASDVSLTGGALVTTQSKLEPLGSSLLGNGGDIAIQAANRVTLDHSSVTASSDAQGLAGNITIEGGGVVEIIGGSVTTEAVEADGGNIKIAAEGTVYLLGGNITTSVLGAGGTGGNIDIDPQFVILQGGSNVLANAKNPAATQAGNIYITGDYILISPDSLVEATGPTNDTNGEIIIRGPDGELSRSLAQLPESYLDATGFRKGGCGAAQTGLSSLVLAGRGGIPAQPTGYVPSFDLAAFGLSGQDVVARADMRNMLVALGPRDPTATGWLLAERDCR
jgi:filamentous hemagglutinin family protein